MDKGNFLFCTFCLVVTMGLMESFSMFNAHFSPEVENQKRIAQLQRQVELKKLQAAELQNQIIDFQQQVALQLPALQRISPSSKNFQLRSLASITQAPTKQFDLSATLLDRGQAQFRDKNFTASAQTFHSLINQFPTSPLVIQAHFFWAESLFLSGEQQKCLDVIDQMIELYPEQELTGFIMLRMGQILQARNRGDEASEVYRAVEQNFASNQELAHQAKEMLQSTL